MKSLPSNAVLWFGVLGGASAWMTQFVANLGFTFADCNQSRMLPVRGWEIGLSVGAILVCLASGAVSLRLFLRTRNGDDVSTRERRGEGVAPPLGRIHFLSIVGLMVNFLALAIVVMTGIGAPLLPVCQQS